MPIWKANLKAWVALIFFQKWVNLFNRKLFYEKIKILLFLDISSAHYITNLHELKHSEVIFYYQIRLPDQDIIRKFKVKNRKLLIRRILNDLDSGYE